MYQRLSDAYILTKRYGFADGREKLYPVPIMRRQLSDILNIYPWIFFERIADST